MDTFDLQEGLILADEAEDEIKIGDWKIIVKPFWVWLLE
jgi:predicted AAA+ superfamily ATPase